MKRLSLTLALSVLALAACSEPAPVAAPVRTVTAVTTVTASPTPTPEKTAEPVKDEDTADLALEMTWSGMDNSTRKQICDGWNLGGDAREYLLGVFMDSAGDTFDENRVRAFFDGKC